MIEYRVYRLDGVTRQTSTELVEADCDAEIIERLRRDLGTSIKCEIWRGNRVVKRLEARRDDRGA